MFRQAVSQVLHWCTGERQHWLVRCMRTSAVHQLQALYRPAKLLRLILDMRREGGQRKLPLELEGCGCCLDGRERVNVCRILAMVHTGVAKTAKKQSAQMPAGTS